MNTALLLAAVAPLQARLKEIEGENNKARMDIDRLSEICIGLDNQIKANDLEQAEIADLISKISGEKKGYAPPVDVGADELIRAATNYGEMTIFAAAFAWWTNNNNRPITLFKLAEVLGKNRDSFAVTIRNNKAVFCALGDGTWQIHTAIYNTGSRTISVKG